MKDYDIMGAGIEIADTYMESIFMTFALDYHLEVVDLTFKFDGLKFWVTLQTNQKTYSGSGLSLMESLSACIINSGCAY